MTEHARPLSQPIAQQGNMQPSCQTACMLRISNLCTIKVHSTHQNYTPRPRAARHECAAGGRRCRARMCARCGGCAAPSQCAGPPASPPPAAAPLRPAHGASGAVLKLKAVTRFARGDYILLHASASSTWPEHAPASVQRSNIRAGAVFDSVEINILPASCAT